MLGLPAAAAVHRSDRLLDLFCISRCGLLDDNSGHCRRFGCSREERGSPMACRKSVLRSAMC